jgi:uncharacterized protein YggE
MKCLLFSLVILPISVLAEGGLPDKPYIYVEGRAEITKPADLVTMTFDLVGRAPDEKKANEEVQTKANKVFALLKERKIADNDIIAENLQSQPEFESEDNSYQKHGKVTGYTVTRQIRAKVREISIYPKLIDDLIEIGAEFSGIEGGLQNEKELVNDLWSKALTNAREQAERTVKQAGMKIDSVFAISPIPFLAVQGSIFTEKGLPYERRHKIPTAEEVGPLSYMVAAVTEAQEVHVIYLISPAK